MSFFLAISARNLLNRTEKLMKYQPYGYILACALPLFAAQCSSSQVPDAPRVNDRYVRQGHYTPAEDAEKARSSRKFVDNLQVLARSCADVRLVFSDLTSSGPADREVPLSQAEKAELLRLILKIEPVKDDNCALFNPAFTIHMLFTMPDGAVQRVPYPRVTPRCCVSSDGYAFMSWCALSDADAARWYALAKHDWILGQLRKAGKK